MLFVFKRLVLITSIAAAIAWNNEAADKDQTFRAPAAAAMPHHQTNDKVTIGADPYAAGDKIKAAFGKLDPYKYGVLPVLVSIQNDSGQSIRLDRMKAEYVSPNHERVDATPASDVRYSRGVSLPNIVTGPRGGVPGRSKKNPLSAWEIEGRALSAQMLPPGNSAFGFLYFATGVQPGSTLYLSGITAAPSGKELLFFEIPLE